MNCQSNHHSLNNALTHTMGVRVGIIQVLDSTRVSMSWTFSISHELHNSWPIETQPNKFHPEKKGIKLTEIKVKKKYFCKLP
jgi:hypothetical protein